MLQGLKKGFRGRRRSHQSHCAESAQKKRGNQTVCKVELCTAHSLADIRKNMNIHTIYTQSFIAAKPTALHVTHAIISVDTAKFRISGNRKRDRMDTYTCYAIL